MKKLLLVSLLAGALGRRCVFIALLLLAGCSSLRPVQNFTPTLARFFLESDDAGNAVAELPISGVHVAIGEKPVLTEGDVVAVELVQVELGKCLMFQLTPAAARDLYRLTGASQGRRLVLMLNNVPVGARRIDAPIMDGRILVFAEISDAALPILVSNLRETTVDLQRKIARAK